LDLIPQFQYLPNAGLSEAQVVFLPVAYDDTVCGRKGTAQGPRAIFEASRELEYYEEDLGWSPFLRLWPCVLPELRRGLGETESAFHATIGFHARTIAEQAPSAFPVILGGEHSITPSAIAGFLTGPATIVVLDAHADLRRSYQNSTLSHACTMHRLREQGWRVIIIGLRSLADFEATRLNADEGLSAYWARELHSADGRAALRAALSAIEGDVWLSVDMDVFDPALVPGVGTPQPGGLSWDCVIDILGALFDNASAEIRGLDVVELIPEPSLASQVTAAKLVQKTISHWGHRKGYQDAPKTGAQAGVAYE